ncbi:MAG TPA: hypothetical protein VN613_08160 [Gemmatimonadaceae bacterium]|nr:hypothetical protein [Gemmatimonadaceae bacterium]
MKRLFAAALLAWMSFAAHATSYSTDVTDLWYIPSESGWGVNFIQQEDTLFGTFFVYGPDNKPTWYVAPGMIPTSSGSLTFAGDLYTTTTGSWFGATWNPSLLGNRKVGTATFTLQTVTTGTLTYSIDGVSVTKQVVRQLWKYEVLGGTYPIVLAGTTSGCGQGIDGYSETPALLTVTQGSDNSVSIVESVTGGTTCNYTGTYTQAGRMGTISASGNCGNLDADEVQTTFTGITFRLTASTSGSSCKFVGNIAGVRR